MAVCIAAGGRNRAPAGLPVHKLAANERLPLAGPVDAPAAAGGHVRSDGAARTKTHPGVGDNVSDARGAAEALERHREDGHGHERARSRDAPAESPTARSAR